MRGTLLAILCVALGAGCTKARAQDVGDDSMMRPGIGGKFGGMQMPGGAPDPTPMFDINGNDGDLSGPSVMPLALTNSVSGAVLELACDAEDVSGTDWNCIDAGGAVVLSETGSGSSPTEITAASGFMPVTDPLAEARKFSATGKQYAAASNDVAATGTDDLIVSALVRQGTTGIIVAKNNGANGWRLITSAAGRVQLVIEGRTGCEAWVPDDAWATITATYDQGLGANGCRIYGGPVTNTATTSGTDDLTVATPIRIGSRSSAGFPYNGAVAAVRVWSCSGCLNNATSADTIAIAGEIALKTQGLWPDVSDASTEVTYATGSPGNPKHVDFCDAAGDNCRLHRVNGAEVWMSRRPDSTGTVRTGWHQSQFQASLTYFQQSESFDNAYWTKTNVTVAADARPGPIDDAANRAEDVESVDGGGDVEHCIERILTPTGDYQNLSFLVKAGSVSRAFLDVPTVANARVWFHLTGDGTVGTTGAGVDSAGIWPFVDGWYYIYMVWDASAVATTMKVCGAAADADTTYDDGTNSTVDFSVFGGQTNGTGGQQHFHVRTTTSSGGQTVGYWGFSATGNVASPSGVASGTGFFIFDYDNRGVVPWVTAPTTPGGAYGSGLGWGQDSVNDRSMCLNYGQVFGVGDIATNVLTEVWCPYNATQGWNYTTPGSPNGPQVVVGGAAPATIEFYGWGSNRIETRIRFYDEAFDPDFAPLP